MGDQMKATKHSQACTDLATDREGCKLVAYWDPTGHCWTIGRGHTRGVYPGMTCTQQQADDWLQMELDGADEIVLAHATVDLTQGQLDACSDFVYNEGPGMRNVKDGFVVLKNGEPSTLLKMINAGNKQAAAVEFPKWNKSGGVVLPGLVIRRKKEQELFLS